jgi:hypothetical protein
MACTTKRTTETRQQPHRKKCMLLNKIANNGMTVSFSHRWVPSRVHLPLGATLLEQEPLRHLNALKHTRKKA